MLTDRASWIHHLRATAGAPGPSATDGLPPAVLEGPGIDGLLWRATADPRVDPDPALFARPGGSLVDLGRFRTIEVWTESELSALHALWRLCRLRPTAARIERLRELRDWHLEHTQPDNATNRPWAVHVYADGGSPEHALYAETLLLNVQASTAHAEPLSRWILLDAANELARAAAAG